MLISLLVVGGLVGLVISFCNLLDVRLFKNYISLEIICIYDIKGRFLVSFYDEVN